MSINHTQYPDHFVSYETNRITCDYPNEETFLAALEIFDYEGFDTSTFYILQGNEGIKALDPNGEGHGMWSKFMRTMHSVVSEAESQSLIKLVDNLKQGMIHIAIPAADKQVRNKAYLIMKGTKGRRITYFDRFYVETFENAS
ncbi:MAG: hypothetical protein MK132_22575 [Lentisphaerales bacterium]|nr:hypothetical protein [Lentisphaerales bacterium]